MILEAYKPKKFGKEVYEINGNRQYPMFAAVALGAKPLYDEWVDVNRYEYFVRVCKDYGMLVEPDVVFHDVKEKKENVIGGDSVTTTYCKAGRFTGKETGGSVHMFISRSRNDLLRAKRFGWYSLMVGKRMIHKPFIDHLRFGEALGYPGCCIDSFRNFNNWKVYNHPYETFRNTFGEDGGKGSYLCNNFPMDFYHFYIHHLPCSYLCRETMDLARSVEDAIMEVEPHYVQKTSRILRMPLLAFGERNFIVFDGEKEGDTINYKDCQYIENMARREDSVGFFDTVSRGNRVELSGGRLSVYRKGNLLGSFEARNDWFMMGFD